MLLIGKMVPGLDLRQGVEVRIVRDTVIVELDLQVFRRVILLSLDILQKSLSWLLVDIAYQT
jgi:hypothetical protein